MSTKVRIKLLDGTSVIRYIWSDDRETDGTVIVTEEKHPDMTCDRTYKYDQSQIQKHLHAVEPMNFNNPAHVKNFFNTHQADGRKVFTRLSDLGYMYTPTSYEWGFDIYSFSFNPDTDEIDVKKEVVGTRFMNFHQVLSDKQIAEKVLRWGKKHLEIFKKLSYASTFTIAQIMIKVVYLSDKLIECELLTIIDKWSNDEVCIEYSAIKGVIADYPDLVQRTHLCHTLPAVTGGGLTRGSILISPLSEYILFVQ